MPIYIQLTDMKVNAYLKEYGQINDSINENLIGKRGIIKDN